MKVSFPRRAFLPQPASASQGLSSAGTAQATPEGLSEASKALFRRPGVNLPPSDEEPQARSPIGMADFFGALVAAERLARDPGARAAADLLRRRAKSLKAEEQKRRANEQRVRRVARYERRG